MCTCFSSGYYELSLVIVIGCGVSCWLLVCVACRFSAVAVAVAVVVLLFGDLFIILGHSWLDLWLLWG